MVHVPDLHMPQQFLKHTVHINTHMYAIFFYNISNRATCMNGFLSGIPKVSGAFTCKMSLKSTHKKYTQKNCKEKWQLKRQNNNEICVSCFYVGKVVGPFACLSPGAHCLCWARSYTNRNSFFQDNIIQKHFETWSSLYNYFINSEHGDYG